MVMVLGIVGLAVCAVTAPFAWVMGRQAVREIDESHGTLGGRGQAMAGYVLGVVGSILLILVVVYMLFIVSLVV